MNNRVDMGQDRRQTIKAVNAKMKLRKKAKTEVWIRYFDEDHSTYYLHNEETDETKWEDELDDKMRTEITIVDGTGICIGSEGNTSDPNNQGEQSPPLSHASLQDSDSDDERIETGFQKYRRLHMTDVVASVDENGTASANNALMWDFRCHSCFVYVNAVLIEAPFVVAEGVIRCILLLLVAVIRLFYLIFTNRFNDILPSMLPYIRELLLTLAAIITLIVPGTICLVYKNYNAEVDWDLAPIPTLLGYVDARRFAVITYCGSGSMAYSIQSNTGYKNTQTTDPYKSQDSCGSSTAIGTTSGILIRSIPWLPTDIISDTQSFLAGEVDSINALHIHL